MNKQNRRNEFIKTHLPFIVFSMIILAIFLFLSLTAHTQTNWTRYEGNPVIEPGPPGSWDDSSILGTCVLKRDTVYHMWYGGSDGSHYRIGHATSTDGITWVKDSLNPVLDIGAPGSFDQLDVLIPNVIHINNLGINGGGTYHMYYDGDDGQREQIGHATSEDGISWVKDSLNPVVPAGMPGSWDEYETFPMGGSVIHDDNLYKMWYAGLGQGLKYRIGYATSTDGYTWTKYENNPVMMEGQSGGWYSTGVLPGSVIYDGWNYQIWFSGCKSDWRWRLGYATSTDGLSWTINPDPVLDYGPIGNWDHTMAWAASVINDNDLGQYRMYYIGGPFENGKIGYATGDSINVGIEKPAMVSYDQNLLKCFPNPVRTKAWISYDIPETGSISLKLYNVNGRLIQTLVSTESSRGTYEIMLNSEDYEKGLYILSLETRTGSYHCKIIIQ